MRKARGKPGRARALARGRPARTRAAAWTATLLNNGAVGVEVFRDGRGAAFVLGVERGGDPIDLFRRPLDPLQARGHFFYVSEDGEEPWSIGFEPARRAARLSARGARVQSHRDRQCAERRRSADGGRARRTRRGAELAHSAREQVGPAPPAAPHELLRNRRRRDRRLRSRSRLRRHACRNDIRARSGRHSRAQSAFALGARRPWRNLVLRGEARRRDQARRLRRFAQPFPRRGFARAVPPVASLGAGASWTTKARSGRSTRPRASRSRPNSPTAAWRRPNSSSAGPTTRSGRAN